MRSLCFLPRRPEGWSCNRNSHTRSHKPHGHSPQRSTCPSPPGLGVPPTPLGLGGAPWGGCMVPAPQECQQGPSSTAVPGSGACVCSTACPRRVPACPSCAPRASWGGALKISLPPSPPPSPTTMFLLACVPGNASPANFPASKALPLCIIILLGSCLPSASWSLCCPHGCGVTHPRPLPRARALGTVAALPGSGSPPHSHCTTAAGVLGGTAAAAPLHSHRAGSARPWCDRCPATAWSLCRHRTAFALPLRNCCVATV